MSERLYVDVLCPHSVRLGQVELPIGAVAMIVQPYVAHCPDCARERNRPHCRHHDFPLDEHGMCEECYRSAEDQRRTDADIDHLWRTR